MTFNLSLGSAALGDLPFEDVLKSVAALNIRSIDWQLDSTLEMNSVPNRMSTNEIKDAFASLGITLACLSNVRDVELLMGPHSAHTDPIFPGSAAEKQGYAMDWALRTVRLARDLAVRTVRLYFGCSDHLLMFPWHGYAVSDKVNVEQLVDIVEPIFAEAAESDITICVEPHPRQAIFTADSYMRARDLLGARGLRLALCFDPANLAAGGLDPVDWLASVEEAPRVVHLKDVQVWRRSTAPRGIGWRRYGPGPLVRFRAFGEGDLRWQELRDALQGCAFSGDAVLEFEDQTVDRIWGIESGRDRATRLFGHWASSSRWW